MNIKPNENVIESDYIILGSDEAAKQASDRIYFLTRNHLEKITTASGGWEILFRDPDDLRFWELSYPKSEMHGGGPTRLSCISKQDAKIKYNIDL